MKTVDLLQTHKNNVREKWQDELVHSIRSIEDLSRVVGAGQVGTWVKDALTTMRMSITPHSARLIDWSNARDPLYLMAVPAAEELVTNRLEIEDPIGDTIHEKVPFLTHRYANRVLIYPTFSCSQYCRFCFRRFRTGTATLPPSLADMDRMHAYLLEHPEIDEVIFSGGDPFTLVDALLEKWLAMARSVPTVSRIRIHTRVPVNLPSRITDEFVAMLKKYQSTTKPVIVVTHFNHPREISEENIVALARLVDAGIVVRNQSVLLKGVNDDADTLAALMTKLVNVRVQPYYLHQLDIARGTNHFRVPIARGLEIVRALQPKVSGIAMPRYTLEAPGGNGKVQLPGAIVGESRSEEAGMTYVLRTPSGALIDYNEPM